MVTWAIVEEPHGRFNPRAAERLASRILAEAVENWLADIEIRAGEKRLRWLFG